MSSDLIMSCLVLETIAIHSKRFKTVFRQQQQQKKNQFFGNTVDPIHVFIGTVMDLKHATYYYENNFPNVIFSTCRH